MSANKVVFQRFYPTLVETLPMNDAGFIANLFLAKLLPGDSKGLIEAQPTKASKASYFLDHVIQPSIMTGVGTAFDDLIKVMEDSKYGDVKVLAKLIRKKLREEAVNNKTG